jgi:hypothetical protein
VCEDSGRFHLGSFLREGTHLVLRADGEDCSVGGPHFSQKRREVGHPRVSRFARNAVALSIGRNYMNDCIVMQRWQI